MSAQYVSSHPNATISLYIGIITTCAGRMSTLSTCQTRNSYREVPPCKHIAD